MQKKRTSTQEERNDIMTLATYNKQHEKNMREMDEYINSFKKLDRAEAEKKAKESLIRSGVLNKDGTVKERICNL
ncbi:MAG: hypothetical protein J1E01_06715 [Acetatifactor sp.]|nr:hypothetical protein [Acetatifactor sp.]